METFNFPQFPTVAHAALYTNVKNSALLRKRIIDASTAEGAQGEEEREAVNFAFIDARLITSRLHLQTAIYQAILAETQKSLRTRTVHSEILWALNPTNNITEAIRRYGVSDTSTTLVVVRLGALDAVQERMSQVVSGKFVPFSGLGPLTDWATIKKYHKLNNDVAVKNAAKGEGRTEKAIVDSIVVSMVATKSVMA